jgi:integrase/recombinase XerD
LRTRRRRGCRLERERGFATPYADGLNRYAAVKGRPKTLSDDFVKDLLEATGGGRARDFETARDHAMIRILRSEGIRRSEVLGMVMSSLPADVIRNPVFRLVPLKGARAVGEGRLVVLAPATARALATYLRARRSHRQANCDWVWLGTQGRGRFQNTGIRKMLIRRAEQAGYAGVTPYQFRHTFSDAWLKSGGSEDSVGFVDNGPFPLHHYTPVETTVNAAEHDLDDAWHAYDLALDCVNQGGVATMRTMHRPADKN